MAAVAFDTLKFARRLKEAGVPEQQAEAQAELMAEAFVFNMDKLVTTDYLDAKLDAVDGNFDTMEGKIDAMEGKIDVKLKELEARLDAKWDARLDEKLSNYPTIDQMDARFANVDAQFAKLDARFAQIDGKFRLIFWMLAAIMASITIPALHTLLTAG